MELNTRVKCVLYCSPATEK